MKRVTLVAGLLATPAYAHHEIIMTTSMMPLIGGMALIVAAAISAMRNKLRKRPPRHQRPSA